MAELLPALLLILTVIAVMSYLAPRIAIPAPVLIALSGVIWSLLPGLPRVRIDPQIVLSIFLPPLLYADAWTASWTDFRRWLRSILQLAVGLVAVTTLVVGVAAKLMMPELPWGACFLLGAIVSPTDTVAVHAVLERLRIPPRATAILGGESLVNDATGLLAAGLATVVVVSGKFEPAMIGISFARIAGIGVLVGALVGMSAATINCWVRGTEVLFVLSLAAPYAAYYGAHLLGASGVLAVVIAGFVASWRMHYIAPQSRVELYSSWRHLVFLLNGLMFLYVGLEAPLRLRDALGAAPGLIVTALVVSLVVIVARIVWIIPAAYIPPFLLPRLRQKELGYPPLRGVILASWCGVRGAVSLAAALALPLVAIEYQPFPGRDQIIACTLVTILVTLVGQGTTLLPLIRLLGVSDADPTALEVRRAKETILIAGISSLEQYCSEESCPVAVYRYRDLMQDQLAALRDEDQIERDQALRRLAVAREVREAVYASQTEALLSLRNRGALNDRLHQDLQLELDSEQMAFQRG